MAPPMIAPSCPYFILFASLATARSLPVLPSSDTLSTNKVGLSTSDANASAAQDKALYLIFGLNYLAVSVYALPNLFFKNLSMFFIFFNSTNITCSFVKKCSWCTILCKHRTYFSSKCFWITMFL